MSESLSVYGRYVVGLLSVWVRDCRSAVGYESSIVLMIGFQSVSCRLSIGLKSGDSIPNLTRHEPDWFYGVFSNIVGGRQLADSVKNLCFLSVSCRFGRCDWGHDCLLNRLFRRRSKKTWKFRVTALCEGNSPVTSEFPAQRASNAEMFPFDDVIMITWGFVGCHYSSHTTSSTAV